MTGELLRRIAEEMPAARIERDLWRAGRRRRRNRRWGYAALAVAVLAAGVALPEWASSRRAAHEPADRPPAIPSRVFRPYLWQAKIGQWPAGPPGPTALVFYTDATRYFETTGVAVGPDGGYRLIYQAPGEGGGVLSPDGRHYVRPGGLLLDLTTGDEHLLGGGAVGGVPGAGSPLAWSPDGRELLLGVSNDDAVITYGADGRQVNDPEKPDDLVAVDIMTGERRYVAVGIRHSYGRAAWSPDGRRIIVDGSTRSDEADRRVSVLDATTGAPLWTKDTGPRRSIGGRGAWHPGGGRVAVLAFDGCADPCRDGDEGARRWRVEFLDPATGTTVGEPVPLAGIPGEVVGWRGGRDVVMTYTPDRDGTRHQTLVAVRPDGTVETLVATPPEVTGIEVADRAVAAGAFGGPAHRPSPWAAAWWAYAIVALPVSLAGLALLRLRRAPRRRSPGPAARPSRERD